MKHKSIDEQQSTNGTRKMSTPQLDQMRQNHIEAAEGNDPGNRLRKSPAFKDLQKVLQEKVAAREGKVVIFGTSAQTEPTHFQSLIAGGLESC